MIPDFLQRFILTSIESVPHLEAILLLRYNPVQEWSPKQLAQTLFINEKKAEEILNDLCSGHVVHKDENGYHYEPALEIKEKIDQLADLYAKHLIEVTNLIHSKANKQAQQFGDAFKWQKED